MSVDVSKAIKSQNIHDVAKAANLPIENQAEEKALAKNFHDNTQLTDQLAKVDVSNTEPMY
jgi:Asp-tRNA(Asn)/Glu-tRNA(Gln) amidotransferase C subunit